MTSPSPSMKACSLVAGAAKQAAMFEGILWLGVVVIASVIGFLVVWSIKNKIAKSEKPEPEFTLQQLRDLRDRGELTTSQYDALRQRLVDGSTDQEL